MAKKMEFEYHIEEDYTSLRQIDRFVSAEQKSDDFLINTFIDFKPFNYNQNENKDRKHFENKLKTFNINR